MVRSPVALLGLFAWLAALCTIDGNTVRIVRYVDSVLDSGCVINFADIEFYYRSSRLSSLSIATSDTAANSCLSNFNDSNRDTYCVVGSGLPCPQYVEFEFGAADIDQAIVFNRVDSEQQRIADATLEYQSSSLNFSFPFAEGHTYFDVNFASRSLSATRHLRITKTETDEDGCIINLGDLQFYYLGSRQPSPTITSSSMPTTSLYSLVDNDISTTCILGAGRPCPQYVDVELQSDYPVDSVVIFNRQDCCQNRTVGMKVEYFTTSHTTTYYPFSVALPVYTLRLGLPSMIPAAMTNVLSFANSQAGDTTATPSLSPSQPSGTVLFIASALFTSNGDAVTVTLSNKTNRAGIATPRFPCSSVLAFRGAAEQQCSWTTDRVLSVRFARLSMLEVGSAVALANSSNLLILCASASNYTPSLVSTESVAVQPPYKPETPVIGVVSPPVVSICGAWDLDFSSSTISGGLGRAWKESHLEVSCSSGSAANCSTVAMQIKEQFALTPFVSIPKQLLSSNATYSIQLKVCNFLGGCGVKVFSTTVGDYLSVPPTIRLLGGSREASTWRLLSITASVSVIRCGDSESPLDLAYTWTLLRAAADGSSYSPIPFQSQSKLASKIVLPPFTLEVGSEHVAIVTVVDRASGLSALCNTSLLAVSSQLVAVLNSSSQQQLVVGGTLVLDASASYDPDVLEQSELRYEWTCEAISGIAVTCPLSMTAIGHRSIWTAAPDALNSSSILSVHVRTLAGEREAVASVEVRVTAAGGPVITWLTPSTSVTKVNANDGLSLSGSVFTEAMPCTPTWSIVVSNRSLVQQQQQQLSAAVVPPLQATLTTLYLPPYSLPDGQASWFSLSCGSSVVSIEVVTNDAPTGGRFSVTPDSGTALSMLFSFRAWDWSDADLPISYSFQFQSAPGGSFLPVQANGVASQASAILPAGREQEGRRLSVRVLAGDDYGASTSAQDAVTVVLGLEEPLFPTVSRLLTNYRTMELGRLQNAIAASSAAINEVDCSLAPNCSLLHRHPCAAQANTCGACWEGYVSGESELGNSACFHFSSSWAATPISASCSPSLEASCPEWQYCDRATSQCVDRNKTCASPSCSGHGSCEWLSLSSGRPVSQCSLRSTACRAVCLCAAGFAGPSCDVTTAEHDQQQALRRDMIEAMQDLWTRSDVDASSDTVTLVASIVRSRLDLTHTSAERLVNLSQSLLSSAPTLDSELDTELLSSLLPPLDAAMDVATHSASGASLASACMDAVEHFGDLMHSTAIQMEVGSEFVRGLFRLATSVLQPAIYYEPVAVPVAKTADERTMGDASQPSIKAGLVTTNNRSASQVFLSSIVYRQQAWQAGLNSTQYHLSSDVVVVRSSAGLAFVDIALNLTDSSSFDSEGLSFRVNCTVGVVESRTYICPDSGLVLPISCNGRYRAVHGRCPALAPSCGSMDLQSRAPLLNDSASAATGRQVCQMLRRSEGTLFCRCWPAQTDRRRLDSHVDSQVTSVVALAVVGQYSASDFSQTFELADEADSSEEPERVYVVIALYCSLWGSAVLAMIYFSWKANCTSQGRQKGPKSRKKSRISKDCTFAVPQAQQGDFGVGGETEASKKLAAYIASVFPMVFEARSMLTGMRRELAKHHFYFRLWYSAMHSGAVNVSIVKMTTIMSFMLFLLAVLYDQNYRQDDGSCSGAVLSKDDCLSRNYLLDEERSYCQWDDSTQSCSFKPAQFTFMTALYISMFVALLTCVATVPLEMLCNILRSPSDSQADKMTGRGELNLTAIMPMTESLRLTSRIQQSPAAVARSSAPKYVCRIIPAPTVDAHIELQEFAGQVLQNVTPLLERRESMREKLRQQQSHRVFGRAATSKVPLNAAPASKPSITRRFNALKLEALLQRRLIVDPAALAVFNAEWCLDSTREDFLEFTSQGCLSMRPSRILMEDMLRKELESVQNRTNRVLAFFAKAKDVDKGTELLQLFARDLLGRNTPAARIFAHKVDLDFERVPVVHIKSKVVVGMFLLILNIFFVYYTLLRGMNKGWQWQWDFAEAWAIQVLLEICLFETFECFWLHVITPSLVSSEVARVHALLQESAQALCNAAVHVGREPCLNAPDYLFVSHRAAMAYPWLLESAIVRSYTSMLPGELHKVWHKQLEHCTNRPHLPDDATNASPSLSLQGSWWTRALRRVLVFSAAVHVAAFFPIEVQRLLIRTIEPIVLSGLVLLAIYLLDHPVYFSVAVVIIVGFLALLVWDYFGAKKEVTGRPLAAVGVAPADMPATLSEALPEESDVDEPKALTRAPSRTDAGLSPCSTAPVLLSSLDCEAAQALHLPAHDTPHFYAKKASFLGDSSPMGQSLELMAQLEAGMEEKSDEGSVVRAPSRLRARSYDVVEEAFSEAAFSLETESSLSFRHSYGANIVSISPAHSVGRLRSTHPSSENFGRRRTNSAPSVEENSSEASDSV